MPLTVERAEHKILNQIMMSDKNLYLIFGIIAMVLFTGAFYEPQNSFFGVSVKPWFLGLLWLVVAIFNFSRYFKLKKDQNDKL
jgi:uncharacterized membrane protein HdeD (DUF308 family)